MARLHLLLLFTFASQVLSYCKTVEVRKEWRNFTTPEKTAWISAVKCLANLPHNDSLYVTIGQFASIANISATSSYYDDFVYVHSDLNPKIHFTGLFFPWHRLYVWAYNNALKSSCGYTGVAPYWDWTLDSADVPASPIFETDPSSGLGTLFGVPSNDLVVDTGGFASDFTLAYPVPHGLRRNYTLQPYLGTGLSPLASLFPDPAIDANATFTPARLAEAIGNYTGDFKAFQTDIEAFTGPHGGVHFVVGGDLAGSCPAGSNAACIAQQPSPTFSANEPMFWLHHGNIDRVWWLWQNAHPANQYAYHGGSIQNITSVAAYEANTNGYPPWLTHESVMPGDGILPGNVTIGDVLRTEGNLCYTYDQ